MDGVNESNVKVAETTSAYRTLFCSQQETGADFPIGEQHELIQNEKDDAGLMATGMPYSDFPSRQSPGELR